MLSSLRKRQEGGKEVKQQKQITHAKGIQMDILKVFASLKAHFSEIEIDIIFSCLLILILECMRAYSLNFVIRSVKDFKLIFQLYLVQAYHFFPFTYKHKTERQPPAVFISNSALNISIVFL